MKPYNKLNFKFEYSLNFGDGVNPRFWKEITQREISNSEPGTHYLTTGSIMGKATDDSIIFGTGFISDTDNLGGNEHWDKQTDSIKNCTPKHIVAVRGPLTRTKLLDMGLFCPEIYGDPLILLPSLYGKLKPGIKNKVGILPHYADKNTLALNDLKNNLNNSSYDVKELNIVIGSGNQAVLDALVGNFNYEKLIDEILDCEYIISSSLHGLMLGILYGKKTIYVKFTDNIIGGDFKFNDFFYSIGVNYNRIQNFTPDILNNIIPIDYAKLQTTIINLLYHCPFIDSNRKQQLTQNILNFYKI